MFTFQMIALYFLILNQPHFLESIQLRNSVAEKLRFEINRNRAKFDESRGAEGHCNKEFFNLNQIWHRVYPMWVEFQAKKDRISEGN